MPRFKNNLVTQCCHEPVMSPGNFSNVLISDFYSEGILMCELRLTLVLSAGSLNPYCMVYVHLDMQQELL